MSYIGLTRVAASSVPTPEAGKERLFIDVADGLVKKKLSDGTLVTVEQTGSTPPAENVSFTPSGDLTSTNVQAAIQELDAEKTPIGHVGSTGAAHGNATTSASGFMSPTDKAKLDGVQAGATQNDTDANLKNRANHTGSQAASTISDFTSAADARVNAGITAHKAESDPHSQYATDLDVANAQAAATSAAQATSLQKSANLSDLTNVTSARSVLGIGNVDNTSDANKPVSTAQAAADAATLASAQSYADAKVAAVVNSAPEALDTLKELADALNSDPNFATTTATALGNRLRVDTNAQGLNSTQKANAKTNLDLQNVDNTSDANKPVSTAQAAAINAKLTNPLTTDGDILFQDGGVASRLPVGPEEYLLRVVGGKPTWAVENLAQDFGGADLNLSLSGLLTLSGPAYYDTLTLVPGGRLVTNGYPVYCKTLDISVADVGAIRWNGNNGTSTSTQAGQGGGAALTSAMLGGSGAGSAGTTGTATAGAQPTAPAGLSPSNGGGGGLGGTGGVGTGGAAGAARTGGNAAGFVVFDRFEQAFLRGATVITGGAGGAGGSSGGGDGTNLGRGGGGGGSGAGMLAIYAAKIITSASTPSGVIQAIGGIGGNGATATTGNGVGGGAGAGGGGGGYVYLAYLERQGPAVVDLIDCSGGNGGNGGNGFGTGGAGASGGTGGNGGRIRVYNAKNANSIFAVGAAGSAGGAAVGLTGGIGGQGGACKITL